MTDYGKLEIDAITSVTIDTLRKLPNVISDQITNHISDLNNVIAVLPDEVKDSVVMQMAINSTLHVLKNLNNSLVDPLVKGSQDALNAFQLLGDNATKLLIEAETQIKNVTGIVSFLVSFSLYNTKVKHKIF